MKNLVIIDYGMGNLYSILKGLQYMKIPAKISDKKQDIKNACGLILPGVGAFKDAMKEIHKRKLFNLIKEEVKKGKAILGICLGFQLLFTKSYEFGINNGFDFIKGQVIKFKKEKKVPHMGWNTIEIYKKNSKILKGIENNQYFYFVHSFYARTDEKEAILAKTRYEYTEFTSAVEKDKIFGVQFHPEKSGETALLIYKNFYKIASGEF
jgi:glutamine amidotransferase